MSIVFRMGQALILEPIILILQPVVDITETSHGGEICRLREKNRSF